VELIVAYDHYSVAQQFAAQLRKEGKDLWATRIEDAIAAGATATEILMALRWNILQFISSGETCSQETRQLVDELLRELDCVLSR
jgi:hypothetical protein